MRVGKGTGMLFDSRETEEGKAVREMFQDVDCVETLAAKIVMHPGEFGEHVRRTRDITKYLLTNTPVGETYRSNDSSNCFDHISFLWWD